MRGPAEPDPPPRDDGDDGDEDEDDEEDDDDDEDEHEEPPPRMVSFVRHGEAEHNARRGQPNAMSVLDPALTRRGEEQARELAAAVRDSGRSFDVVVTSPLRRAMQTAKLAFGHLEADGCEFVVSPLHTESGRRYRAQQGRSRSTLRSEFPTWDFSGLVSVGPEASLTWTTAARGGAGYMHPKPPSRRLGQFRRFLLALERSKRVVVVGHSGTLLKLVGRKMKNCEMVLDHAVRARAAA